MCDDSIKAFRPSLRLGLFFAISALGGWRHLGLPADRLRRLRACVSEQLRCLTSLRVPLPSHNPPMHWFLWVKAFHIVFVASWFAALFYLPRIFVNLAMVPKDSHAERERLLLMARKLLRFGNLLMVIALLLGLVMLGHNWRGYLLGQGWMWVKLLLVAVSLGFHWRCAGLLQEFEHLANRRSHRWFRVFNEMSVLLFAGAVVMVVVRPF